MKLLTKINQVRATEISHFNMFEMLPNTFVRIKLRRVRGQLLKPDFSCSPITEIFSNLSFVNRRPIPDNHNLLKESQQMTDKKDRVCTGESLLANHGVKPTRHCYAAHNRQMIASLETPKNRRLTAGRICSNNSRQQVESRFINKNYCKAVRQSLFLSSGQTSLRHSSICSSSRWAACWIGVCGVQPSCFSNLDTCA